MSSYLVSGPRWSPCEFGSNVLGDCSSLRGKGWPGGAEEWLGLGQTLKDSFLHGVPRELGSVGSRCALWVSVPAGGVRVSPTTLLPVA